MKKHKVDNKPHNKEQKPVIYKEVNMSVTRFSRADMFTKSCTFLFFSITYSRKQAWNSADQAGPFLFVQILKWKHGPLFVNGSIMLRLV